MAQLPKDPIQEINARAYNDLVRVSIETALSNSAPMDKTTTVLVTGLAATAGLTAANLDKLRSIVSQQDLAIFLFFLIVAILCGVAAKGLAMIVQLQLRSDRNIRREFPAIIARANNEISQAVQTGVPIAGGLQIDIVRLQSDIAERAPWFIRRKVNRNADAARIDPLHGFKNAADRFNAQLAWSMAALFFSILAISFIMVKVW